MKYTAKDNFVKIGRAFRGNDNFDEPRTREEWHNLIGSVIPDSDFAEWFEEARTGNFLEWFAQHPDQSDGKVNLWDVNLDAYVGDFVQEKIAEATAPPEQPFSEFFEQNAESPYPELTNVRIDELVASWIGR